MNVFGTLLSLHVSYVFVHVFHRKVFIRLCSLSFLILVFLEFCFKFSIHFAFLGIDNIGSFFLVTSVTHQSLL